MISSAELPIGSLLDGRYLIHELLHRGAVGAVYAGVNSQTNEVVAIKEIEPPPGDDDSRVDALREIETAGRLLAALRHRGLPRVSDAFIEKSRAYVIMEYVPGQSLQDLLGARGRAPLDLSDAVHWACQIAEALSYLHAQNPPIVFRELAPSHIIVGSDGQVRLVDFGLASRLYEETPAEWATFERLAYIPRGPVNLRDPDPRMDVFAFGATVFQMVTGLTPGLEPFGFPSANSVNPNVSDAISQLLAQCLVRDASRRPDSAEILETLSVFEPSAAGATAVVAATNLPPNGKSNGTAQPKKRASRRRSLDEIVEFADNPEPRCPCVLLLDCSSSMDGAPIEMLRDGLEAFKYDLLQDSLASKRVELAIVTFGRRVEVAQEFTTADRFHPPILRADGMTPMGAAIDRGIDLIDARKQQYRNNGIDYFRPWMFLITDGAPSDSVNQAADRVREGEERRKFSFYAVGVEGADMEYLKLVAARPPIKLKGLQFGELFLWLSASMQAVTHDRGAPTPTLDKIGALARR